LINLAAGVAICQAVADTGVQVHLKWPNDVMAGSRKTAGILSEGRGSAVILGMGINVNVESFPNDLNDVATSLAIEAGRTFDRLVLLEALMAAFQRVYSSLPDGLSDLYRPWCRTLGRAVRVELPRRTTKGIAVDIDRRGGLMLSTGEVLQAGDVVHLREVHQDWGAHGS
jgi:BirA family biotin operon repressor/biotin-[acetyl-CoA-carboxylase] ligase